MYIFSPKGDKCCWGFFTKGAHVDFRDKASTQTMTQTKATFLITWGTIDMEDTAIKYTMV